MNYQKINVITGWTVWLIASIVYLLTIEPTSSFWDCGEFIASAYKLEVGHPPGAPLFMLLARFFAMFASPENAAYSVNILSALCSSFTILFLFWSITHLAKKIVDRTKDAVNGHTVAVMASGVVGGLAYTFSDSFWFSAVEGEVYAMSSLFTAVVFWAILKWESVAHRKGELRWVILIAYLMGLSTGVHLLNLLAIPAISFVYYFKRYEVTTRGVITTGIVSLFLLGLIQVGIIQGMINFAAKFELLFVNSMGLPFNTGVIIYALLIATVITTLLVYSKRKNWPALNTLVLGVLMVIVGYSTFTMIVVRSSANPPMDENNPENLFSLLSYLNREQYGDRPLLYGQYFTTPTISEKPYVDGKTKYIKSYSIKTQGRGKDKLVESFKWKHEADAFLAEMGDSHFMVEEYVQSNEKKSSVPNYDPEFCGILPRMYSASGNHIAEYKQWSNYKGWNSPRTREKVKSYEASKREKEGKLNAYIQYYNQTQDPSLLNQLETEIRALQREINKLNERLMPTYAEDFRFFMSYQVGWMYGRYFMWNFAGKQDDVQGHGGFSHGNWLSGLDFIDEQRLGNRDRLPESVKNNRGFNKYYYLPLILGLIGLVFQLLRSPQEFTVVSLLFVLTGFAILVYLNQYPLQPRERDYAYVGSFYAFSIWIGMGVYALFYASRNMNWKDLGLVAGMTIGGSVVIYLLESVMSDSNTFSLSLLYMSVISILFFAVAVLLRTVKVNSVAKAGIIGLVCLSAPFVMAKDGWDDHTRAKRKTAVDFAKNYLDSLEPNAIIFTNGDNDTFPLWFVQEVEGYRTDVRIVNMSLLNTDWYIDQMKRKAYDSDPVPFKIPEQKYRQGTRDIILLVPEKNVTGAFIDVGRALDIAIDDSNVVPAGDGKNYAYLPTNKFSLPVDSARILELGIVKPEEADMIVPSVDWEVKDGDRPKPYILKNSMMLLDLLRNNNWERPIYFAVTTGPEIYLGLESYFRLEGLAYRLVPIKYPKSPNPNVIGGIDTDIMYRNIMEKFQWGNMDDTTGIYMDENNRRMTTNFRLQFANLAEELIKENDTIRAVEVLNKSMEVMPEKNVPYDRVVLPMVEAYFMAGAQEEARDLAVRLFEIYQDDFEYWASLEPEFANSGLDEAQLKLSVNGRIQQVLNHYMPDDPMTKEITSRVDSLYTIYSEKDQEIKRVIKGDF